MTESLFPPAPSADSLFPPVPRGDYEITNEEVAQFVEHIDEKTLAQIIDSDDTISFDDNGNPQIDVDELINFMDAEDKKRKIRGLIENIKKRMVQIGFMRRSVPLDETQRFFLDRHQEDIMSIATFLQTL